jgi:predicted acylesterase/phospholipase RssA
VDELRSYIDGLDAEFDGRLRIVALDQANGKRAVFGVPGAPPASVVEAVAASCAAPGIFPPVLGGRAVLCGWRRLESQQHRCC